MQRVFIIGATSAIAESVARLYAADGSRLFITGRQQQRLQAIASDLQVRGASDVHTAVLDVNDYAAHLHVLDAAWEALGGVDVVLMAQGTLPDQPECQASVDTAWAEFSTNATATIALATAIAPRMEQAARGTLAVISSVAGDRGRASNYLYGAAKAAVSTFLSGLGQRLQGSGVHVLIIKPGFVDTPMTRKFKKGVLWATPDKVAADILKSIERRRSVVYTPFFWHPIMAIIRHIPEFIFRRIKL